MLQGDLKKINLDFEFFYETYSAYFKKILILDEKFPEDNSPYQKIANRLGSLLGDVCMKLYLENVLPMSLEKDSKFYEKEFFRAAEKEDIAFLSFLSISLHNNSICRRYISAESKYKLMHMCLDILQKNGTDMIGNNQIAMVYENILILGYTHDMKDYDKPYHLCKKLFALEETDSWKGCNISRMYYETFGGLMGEGIGKREFDLLVDFYHKTTLTFIKEEYLKHHLEAYFLQEGLCDEHFNWIGKS